MADHALPLVRFYSQLVDEMRTCRRSDRRRILALADRIHAAHEVLARRAERRAVVLTERDYCPLTGEG
jgi:hypothetical protein